MSEVKSALIPKLWSLPSRIHRRLGDGAGRQRLMDEEGHLLVILHQPPAASDHERREAVLFWRSPEGDWKSTPPGGGLAAMDSLLTSYATLIANLDRRVDTATSARNYFDILRELNPLLRSTRNLHAVIQATREARSDDQRLIALRDRAVELERAAELSNTDAKNGLDFTLAENARIQARAAEQANAEARRLNRLVACFFPLATLVAVFGMNDPEAVLGMPGFWLIIGAGMLIGAIILLTGGRKRGSD